jgi:hypothetical protein
VECLNGKVVWSEEHFRILGLDPQDTKPRWTYFGKGFTQTTGWPATHFESAIREKRDFEQEFRIVTRMGPSDIFTAWGTPS